jgi:hypothetical protein
MDDAKKDRLILTVVLTVGFFFVVGLLVSTYEDENERQKSGEKAEVIEVPVEQVLYKEGIESQIEYHPTDSTSVAILNSALALLKANCIHIKNYIDDGEIVRLYYHDKLHGDYKTVDYGWEKQIEINITIPENYNKYPTDMAGQTLYYYIGNGKRPGIVTGKWQAKMLCGSRYVTADKNSDDILIPVENVSFLK